MPRHDRKPNRDASRAKWCCVALLTLVATGCDRNPSEPAEAPLVRVTQSRSVMGAFAEVTAVAANNAAAARAVEAAYARLEDVNRLMSDYVDDSEIGRLNQRDANDPLIVSPETLTVLKAAAAISADSGGAFDITVRPLVSLWREAAQNDVAPTEAALQAVRARTGWRHVQLEEDTRTVTLAVNDMQLDLGGIAKGYALDLAAEAMQRAGAVGGLVNVGGDVLGYGRRDDGKPWRIGVKDPFADDVLGSIAIDNRAVATSGHQQRFFEIDGRRYSHIIDPRTARPAEQAHSVTVIAPDGLTADAWATAFSVLSVEEGRDLVRGIEGVEVLWVTGTAVRPIIVRSDGFDLLPE